MAKPSSKATPLASISKEAEIIGHVSTELEALARVLAHVHTADQDQKPTISPDDFVCIMELFQEQLASLKDIAGGIEGAVEEEQAAALTLVHE